MQTEGAAPRTASVEMLTALQVAKSALEQTLRTRGYLSGSCTDEWAPEVRGEVAALACVSAAIAKATGPALEAA